MDGWLGGWGMDDSEPMVAGLSLHHLGPFNRTGPCLMVALVKVLN